MPIIDANVILRYPKHMSHACYRENGESGDLLFGRSESQGKTGRRRIGKTEGIGFI